VAIAFAATTASPLMKVSAIGPSNSSVSAVVPALSAARLASRFLTMRNVASASRRFARSSAASGTLIPR
jgi:hypothetical protein